MNFFPKVRGLLQLGEKKSSKPPTPPITSSLNTRTNSNAKIIKINELESQTRRSFPLDMRTKWNGVCRMANTPHYTPTNPPHVYITDPRPQTPSCPPFARPHTSGCLLVPGAATSCKHCKYVFPVPLFLS